MALVKAEKLGDRRLKVVLTEGRHHIVKRMFKTLGYNVVSLLRTRIGNLALPQDFAPGDFRELSEEEVSLLKELVKLK